MKTFELGQRVKVVAHSSMNPTYALIGSVGIISGKFALINGAVNPRKQFEVFMDNFDPNYGSNIVLVDANEIAAVEQIVAKCYRDSNGKLLWSVNDIDEKANGLTRVAEMDFTKDIESK